MTEATSIILGIVQVGDQKDDQVSDRFARGHGTGIRLNTALALPLFFCMDILSRADLKYASTASTLTVSVKLGWLPSLTLDWGRHSSG